MFQEPPEKEPQEEEEEVATMEDVVVHPPSPKREASTSNLEFFVLIGFAVIFFGLITCRTDVAQQQQCWCNGVWLWVPFDILHIYDFCHYTTAVS